MATKYYQVKLINGVDVEEGYTTECLIRFGQENDAKYLDEVMTMIPANSIAIMEGASQLSTEYKYLGE